MMTTSADSDSTSSFSVTDASQVRGVGGSDGVHVGFEGVDGTLSCECSCDVRSHE